MSNEHTVELRGPSDIIHSLVNSEGRVLAEVWIGVDENYYETREIHIYPMADDVSVCVHS